MDKILTVSIAAYNVEKYIERCLESLVNTEILDDLEVLVVDDGSKDATSQIAKKYCETYPLTFRYISKENGGWGSTVNTGISHASGKYFKLLDGDDFYITENLPGYMNFLRGGAADLVLTPSRDYQEKKETFKNVRNWEEFRNGQLYEYGQIAGMLPVISMHDMTVRTNLLRENHMEIMEHCFYTDVQFVIETCSMVRTVAFFHQPVYCYRIGREGQSCCKEGLIKYHEDHKRVVKQCINFVNIHNMPESVKQACIVRINILVEGQYEIYRLFPKDVRKKYLTEWDRELKCDYPDYYSRAGRETLVNRFFRFNGTRVIYSNFALEQVPMHLENSIIIGNKIA